MAEEYTHEVAKRAFLNSEDAYVALKGGDDSVDEKVDAYKTAMTKVFTSLAKGENVRYLRTFVEPYFEDLGKALRTLGQRGLVAETDAQISQAHSKVRDTFVNPYMSQYGEASEASINEGRVKANIEKIIREITRETQRPQR